MLVSRVIELDSISASKRQFHSGQDIRRQISDSVQYKENLCAIIAVDQWDKLPHKAARFPPQDVVRNQRMTCQRQHRRDVATQEAPDL